MHAAPWTAPWTALGPLFHPRPLGARDCAAALDVLVVLSAGVAMLHLLGHLPRGAGIQAPQRAERSSHRALFVFLLLCALLLTNQALVNVYVVREHQGSVSFVARYLPAGWFLLDTHSGVVRWLAAHLPQALFPLLPYTILRVQAALELPFVLSAYLAIAAFLSPELARALWRSVLLPAALLSFTATFCLIEMRLWNPWTLSDLRWRWASCAAVLGLWAVARIAGVPTPMSVPAGSVARLGVLLCGGGALALGVLAIYQVALLYNLRYLLDLWPWLLSCAALGLCAAALSAGARRGVARPALSGVFAGLGTFTWVFFVPSLAIRYAGSRPSAAVAALLLGTAALLGAALLLWRRQAGWGLLGLGLFVAAGALGAWADSAGWMGLPRPAGMSQVPELRLLRGALVFVFAGGGAAAVLDWIVALRCPAQRGPTR